MLKTKLCILIALLLALLLCSGAVAGPKRPNYGDPDIYEGVRPRDGVSQWKFGPMPDIDLVIDIPLLGRVVIHRHEQGYHLRKVAERLPAALKTDLR
jgi:hypothetical protein